MIRNFQPTNNLQESQGKHRELARMPTILLVAHQVQAFESPSFHPNDKWVSNFWGKCSILWIGGFELDEESGVMLRVIWGNLLYVMACRKCWWGGKRRRGRKKEKYQIKRKERFGERRLRENCQN